jgi:hypothetical protein
MNCKGIIEKYRKTDPIYSVCSFDITSTKGSGSRFSFRLPKGFIKFLSLLLLFLPISVSAENEIFSQLNVYADSVFMCNVDEKHEEAFVVAQEALDFLNDYYITVYVGSDGDRKMARFYLQDLYDMQNEFDNIRKFIEKSIEELKKGSRDA